VSNFNEFHFKCFLIIFFILATQREVGFAWIQYKLNKSFTSAKDAQNTIDDNEVPGIIGPDNYIYVVDDHHTLCALDYSGYSSTSVTFNIICDKRGQSLDEFWSYMTSHNLAYTAAHPDGKPNDLPIAISYTLLPTSFAFTAAYISFNDDPWRSIAGFSRKVTSAAAPAPSCTSGVDDKYCERCMYRGCVDGFQSSGGGVAYFEFRWAYYMNDATFHNTSYWPSASALQAFQSAYNTAAGVYPAVMGKVNTDEWFAAADLVVSLCRAETTGSYQVPVGVFPESNSYLLPGYFSGYVKLAADPDCALPLCE